ncbi:MAG TPA: biotin/lipoyl-binding protein [Firmicutes bacterium]|jgi:biotin carboxyl carrier protein|nr:biotin/lipoyl-binding protein [Bacillota bacterium]
MKKYRVLVNGQPYEVEVEEIKGVVSPAPQAPAAPAAPKASPAPQPAAPPQPAPASQDTAGGSGSGTAVEAPMPGSVLEVRVNVGDSVSEGDVLMILEAMKMENEITSPVPGVVKSIDVSVGSTVNTGDAMIFIE